MDPGKPVLKSMTVWSLILFLVGFLKEKFGWNITETDLEEAFNFLLAVTGFLGGLIGRGRATQPLKVGMILLACMISVGCVSSFATFENRKAQVAQKLADKANVFTAIVKAVDSAHQLKRISDKSFLAMDPLIQSMNAALNNSKRLFDEGDFEAADQEAFYFESLLSQLQTLIDTAIRKQIENASKKPVVL